jgi:GTP-binding protein
VPPGTQVFDSETGISLGELMGEGERLVVARGGARGLGNARFKSSTNRAPRKTTPGKPGESLTLRLELKLLADVGLLGAPNAGKSTLLRQVSAARPKVADYPFTTLYPGLGVVRVGSHRSFVMADIPGLIEGAAEGAGLGTRFLRHLSRNRLLLHLVDVAPATGADPLEDARSVAAELLVFSEELASRDRWLVLTKLDLLGVAEREDVKARIVEGLGWDGPVFGISAASGEGCEELCNAVMAHLESMEDDDE